MKPKILLIDDNITIIKIITSYLKEEGFDVFFTTDSTSAVSKAHEVMPDIILLDIVMPILNGFQVCRLLKADEKLNEIPVIILTSETDSRDIKIAMEAGAIDYIRKPADQVELAARVHSVHRITQYQHRLKELALRDSLTGLYNHAAMIDRFVTEYKRQITIAGNVAFIMLDIDFFKKINDTFGHSAGDIILKELSCILSFSVGTDVTVSRYGGEEFGIAMSNTSSQFLKDFCEEIRKNIEEYKFIINDKASTNITVSIGYCFCQASNSIDSNIILKKADDALYTAKKNGRNRVVEATL